MLGGIGSRIQTSVDGGLGQHVGIGNERVDRINALVQVVFDRIEVTVIGVGDLGGDFALRDLVHVARRDGQRADHGVQCLVDAIHNRAEVALVPRRVGTRCQTTFHRGLREHICVRHHGIDRVDALIEVVLDFIEVAVVRIGDLLGDVALRDSIYVLGRHVQRTDDRIQCSIHTFDDGAEVALVLAGIGTSSQSARHSRFRQHVRIGDQRLDRVNALIEIVLDGVEVAVIGIGDLLWNVAFGNPIHALGGHGEGANDGVERVVNALHDGAEVAPVFCRVSSGCQTTLNGRLGQMCGIGGHRIDGIDALIQVVLDFVEITMVGVSDLFRNVALGNAINVFGRHVQRPNHRIERGVDALDDWLELGMQSIDVATYSQLPRGGSLGQLRCFRGNRLNGPPQLAPCHNRSATTDDQCQDRARRSPGHQTIQ